MTWPQVGVPTERLGGLDTRKCSSMGIGHPGAIALGIEMVGVQIRA